VKVLTQQFENTVDCYSMGTDRTWLYVLENQNPLFTGIASNIIKGVLGKSIDPSNVGENGKLSMTLFRIGLE